SFFALWSGFAASGLVLPQFLPSPLAVIERFAQLTHTPFGGYTLQQHLASSFGRFAAGFGLAVAIGIPLGLMMGWFRWLDAIVSTSTVMSGMIAIGIVGFAIDALLRALEARVQRGRGR